MIELRFDPLDLLVGNLTQIGAFRQVPTYQSVNLLVGASFPGVIGMAEVAFGGDGIGNRFMKHMFGAVVQGQGAPTGGREPIRQRRINDGPGGFHRPLPGQFGQEHEPALAFGERIEGGSTFPGDQRIPFPDLWGQIPSRHFEFRISNFGFSQIGLC